MTLQTECPTCQSLYPIPDEQVDNVLAKARCPKCKTTFLINENRLIDASAAAEEVFKTTTIRPMDNINDTDPTMISNLSASDEQLVKKEIQKRARKPRKTDGLGSVDDMNSWMDQQANTISQEKTSTKNSAVNIDKQAVLQGMQRPQQTKPRLSSNYVEPHVHDGENEEWLDQILDQDVSSTANANVVNARAGQNDLNDLLSNYGVNTENPEKNQSESSDLDQLTKMRERVLGERPTQQQMAEKNSPAILFVWSLGCFLLFALLIAQYVLFNINTLIKNPESNNKLLGVCQMLSCRLPGANLDAMVITHIQHRASLVNDSKKNVDIIGALINSSENDQLYPSLKVTIQGSEGLLGEFIAAPKDYLINEQDQLGTEQAKLFMFTVPLKDAQISDIQITSFY